MNMESISGGLHCDFCSSSEIVKDYPCVSFTAIKIPAVTATSEGKWVAYAVCADLVDHDKWEELAVRSLQTSGYWDWPAEKRALLLDFIRVLHRQFREGRLRVN